MRRRSGCCSAPWGRSPLTLCRGRVTSFKKSSPRPSSRPWVVSRRVSRGARDVEPDRRVMLSEAGRSGGAGSPSTLACGTRMRIALVAEDYYPQFGGVPEHVHNLALQLNSWGHTATVVTSHMGAYPDAAFVRRVGTSRMIYSNGGVSRITTGWGLRRQLEALLREGRYDLVHVHGGLAPTFGLAAPLAAWQVGIPVVATFHSWFARSLGCRVFRRPLQKILDRHAATIAVSEPVVAANSRYFRATGTSFRTAWTSSFSDRTGVVPSTRSRTARGSCSSVASSRATAWARRWRHCLASWRATRTRCSRLPGTAPGGATMSGGRGRWATACGSSGRCSRSARSTTRRRTSICVPPRSPPSASRCSRRWRAAHR